MSVVLVDLSGQVDEDMMEYTPEGYAVADAFQKGMAAYQKEPLVLYGTGKNTQAVLNLTKGFNIVGLLDPNLAGKVVYGKPVLTLEEAAACTRRIVIIANVGAYPLSRSAWRRSSANGTSPLPPSCSINSNRSLGLKTPAQRMGISTWQVWSAYELFMASSLWPLLSDERLEIGDRLSLGTLIHI